MSAFEYIHTVAHPQLLIDSQTNNHLDHHGFLNISIASPWNANPIKSVIPCPPLPFPPAPETSDLLSVFTDLPVLDISYISTAPYSKRSLRLASFTLWTVFMQRVSESHSFLYMNNILMCGCITLSLSTHALVGLRIVSTLGRQGIMLLWTFLCKLSCGYVFTSLGSAPGHGRAGSNGNSTFCFLRKLKTVFCSGPACLTPHPTPPHPRRSV